jgi:hypothetical protein
MAKSQKHSNKEARKPKQDKKPKEAVSATGMAPLKIGGAGGFAPKKK